MAPQLIMKAGPQPGQIYPLTKRVTVIGRDPAADIAINANFISRRHMRVGVQNDVVFIEDLGSSNGTYVNGKRIPSKQVVVLEHGDQLGVGPEVSFLVEAPAPQAEPAHTMIYQPAEAAPHTMLMATPPENDDDLLTQIGEAVPPLAADEMHPPQLVVTVAGAEPKLYTLTADRLSIGRAKDNDIVIDSPFVSRQHAELRRMVGGYQLIPGETTNPIQIEGRAIVDSVTLHDDAKLRIGGSNPGEMVTLVYLSPDAMFGSQAAKSVSFDEKSLISIGRDKSNDIVLDSPNVSRFHANIEKVGLRYRLRDLRSANGSFVNDQPVDGETWIKQADSVRIGPYRFEIGAEKLTQFDESGGMRIEAIGLNKWVRKDLNILQDISLVFQPREFIVVVGQSGGGKSTLVDAISGYRRASHGQILANEIDVYENFDAIRQGIGYVPQKDIIHMELSVFQALDYAAQLRMPPDTTEAERHQRIDEVLADLDLTHRRDVKISGLSGGQQKRVSIGVELLTKPGLFFLDEPSSGLDPGTETALMQLMRRLADQGRTIILITHATKNVMLADKVVFLARGGYLAWFGPPEEALAYFDSYRTDRERREKPIEFDDIYNLLDRPD
ncbi:MAG: FHA domain-containing protein, partial [Anaerolineales bacterium]|nr:FHA domain-containing protein [Anaerolineales bacterium]